MSGTVPHVAHLLLGGSCGISSAVWMEYLCLWLPVLCSCGDVYFSASTIQRDRGLRLVGIARHNPVLTQCLFLVVTVALLVVWKIELSGVRFGGASPLGHESSQSGRHVPRFLNSNSAPMSEISLGS